MRLLVIQNDLKEFLKLQVDHALSIIEDDSNDDGDPVKSVSLFTLV